MNHLSVLHTESSCGWGGQELRVLNEAQGLIERGHEVCIAAPEESRIYQEAGRRNLPRIAASIRRKNLQGLRAMRRVLRAQHWDVVNTHSSTDSWLTALARASFMQGHQPALVRTRHISAPIPNNAATRWLYRSASAHVVTTGEALRQQVMTQTGLTADRVTSVPTGIDLLHFQPGDRAVARAALGLSSQSFMVGIVATLRSWKGHRFLVDAIAALPDPQVQLVIVGDGPGREPLRAQIAALNLQERVMMVGHQDNVVPWLQAMDVFVLPSYANEGVPQAIMQAMACGVPVITTAVGAIGEIVTDETNGVIIHPQSSAAITEAVIRIRNDKPFCRHLSIQALQSARDKCAQDVMINKMEVVLKGCIDG
jgi:glycosyltransferase involved in cell wall biosynthesis